MEQQQQQHVPPPVANQSCNLLAAIYSIAEMLNGINAE